MTVLNHLDRYHLALDVLKGVERFVRSRRRWRLWRH
jgi:hypothetical protein